MSEAPREDRLMWVMLLLSAALHGALMHAAGQALEIEFDGPQRGPTTVSVHLVAAPSTEQPTEPVPLEPTPRMEQVRREPLTPEHVLMREEITFEPTPYALSQLERAETVEETPLEEPKLLPVERLKPIVTVPAEAETLQEPKASRTLLSAASSGSEEAIVFHGRVEPRYPRDLWLRQITGEVELLTTIGPDGRVVSTKVFKSSGHAEFDQSALEAVRQWRARPVVRGGVGVAQEVIVPVVFRIRE